MKTPAFEERAGGKVLRLPTPQDWRDFYAAHGAVADELIVQGWIPGADDQT